MTKPAFYTPELVAALCERIGGGRSVRSVCNDEDMPSRESVRRWLKEREDFRAQYAEAKQECVDSMLEDILDIADDRTIDWQDRKVMIAARQWHMSKVAPKRYGDRIEHAGDPSQPLVPADAMDIARRIAFALSKAAAEKGQRAGSDLQD